MDIVDIVWKFTLISWLQWFCFGHLHTTNQPKLKVVYIPIFNEKNFYIKKVSVNFWAMKITNKNDKIELLSFQLIWLPKSDTRTFKHAENKLVLFIVWVVTVWQIRLFFKSFFATEEKNSFFLCCWNIALIFFL